MRLPVTGRPALGLSERRPSTVEQMDRPDCDLDALHRTYRGFGVVNPVVAGWQLTYRRWIRPLLATDHTVTLLDIGSGGGDRPRALARQARRDGFRVSITAIDPDARAHAWATARPSVPGLAFRQATSGDLVAAGERYDVVVSNHLLHHLEPAELDGLLADSERLSARRAVHSDIRRSPAAYALFSAGAGLATPLFPGSFIRPDGLASIRRSYTPGELAAVLRPGWRAHTQLPWRNLAVWDAR
ncbi:class I SAM-dependent methyltransferase [Citricoccus sp. NPDC079358]|uniref:class I SAM-dependent methyltransferase n=1 Tax=Citricoccus sp. NPDC079358 TaxID=3154653 RepID=UPI003450923E